MLYFQDWRKRTLLEASAFVQLGEVGHLHLLLAAEMQRWGLARCFGEGVLLILDVVLRAVGKGRKSEQTTLDTFGLGNRTTAPLIGDSQRHRDPRVRLWTS